MILTLTISAIMVMIFTRGSRACRRPPRLATASVRTVSRRNPTLASMVLSTKLFLPAQHLAFASGNRCVVDALYV